MFFDASHLSVTADLRHRELLAEAEQFRLARLVRTTARAARRAARAAAPVPDPPAPASAPPAREVRRELAGNRR